MGVSLVRIRSFLSLVLFPNLVIHLCYPIDRDLNFCEVSVRILYYLYSLTFHLEVQLLPE